MSVHFNFQRKLDRRTFLRGTRAALALPWLSAMSPSFAGTSAAPPRRFVAVQATYGLHPDNFFPTTSGKDYELSPYLREIADLRDRFTVVSGSSHPGAGGGHSSEMGLLSTAPVADGSPRQNTISIDQLMAKHLGHHTRFRSLVVGHGRNTSSSINESGVMIPAEHSPSRLFEKLFIQESPAAREQQKSRAREGRSMLDGLAEETRSLQRQLGTADRNRLDSYFTSVRDLERRMQEQEEWIDRPKPEVDARQPTDVANDKDLIARHRLMSEMIRLALATDSSRFIAFRTGVGTVIPMIPGVTQDHHELTHHGRDEGKLAQLALIELEIMRAHGDFLRALQGTDDCGGSLLDNTSVLLVSNLGNASSHSTQNLPVLLAGGGFRHGQHLAFDTKNNYLLGNMYVSLLQRVGLEVNKFGSGTGTMRGLEFA